MADIKIPELPEVTSAVDSDLLVVETSSSTKKIKKQNLVFDTTVDPVPTEGSTNAVSSGGVYDALLEKMEKKEIDNEPIENSNNLVTSGGVFHAMEIFDRSIIVDGILRAGQTTLILSDDHFGEDGLLFNIFADHNDISVNSMVCNKQNKTLTLTFDPQQSDINIVVCLENANYPNYEGHGF